MIMMSSRSLLHVPGPCLLAWVIVTSSIRESSSTVASLTGTGRLTWDKVKAEHKYDPMAVIPVSIQLRRTRSTFMGSAPSSLSSLLTLSDVLAAHTQSGWLLDRRPRDSGLGLRTWLRSLDNDVLQPEKGKEKPHKVEPYLPRTQALSSRPASKSALALLKMMIKKKKTLELGEAFRRKHKQDVARSQKKTDDLNDAPLGILTLGDEETEKGFMEMKPQRPDMLGLVASHGLEDGSRWAEGDLGLGGQAGGRQQPGHSFTRHFHGGDTFGVSRVEEPALKSAKLDLVKLESLSQNSEWKHFRPNIPAEDKDFFPLLDAMGRRQSTHKVIPQDFSFFPAYLDQTGSNEKFLPDFGVEFIDVTKDGFHETPGSMVGSFVETGKNGAASDIRGHPSYSFQGSGHFVEENKDCDSIATKSCVSDSGCSCHGFYTCNKGRCDLIDTAALRSMVISVGTHVISDFSQVESTWLSSESDNKTIMSTRKKQQGD